MRAHTNQRREKCVELCKSDNGNKKIATCLKMAICTIRAILKNFKAIGTNLPGRLETFAPTYSEENDKRGKKNPHGSLLENYRGK